MTRRKALTAPPVAAAPCLSGRYQGEFPAANDSQHNIDAKPAETQAFASDETAPQAPGRENIRERCLPDDEVTAESGSCTDEIGDTAPYAVGNKQPPRESQWRPGQSGNLKGRPKQQNLKVLFLKHANAVVDVRDANPQMMHLSQIEGTLHRLFSKSVSGNVDAMKLVLALGRLLMNEGDDEDGIVP